MKRVLGLILALVMVATLFAACGGSDKPADAAADTAGDTATEEKTDDKGEKDSSGGNYKIGLSIAERDQFLSTLENAIATSAEEKGDIDFTAFDAEKDVQKQLDHVTTFASQGFDAIIVNIVDSTVAEGLIKAADGIPIIFVNRLPSDEYLIEGVSAFVGSDEQDSGGLQAEFLADYFKDKEPKEINYVMLMGILGTPHTKLRTDSVKEGLEEAGFTLNKVYEDAAEFDRATAMEKMQQFLGTGKEFDVVICNNDEMALGAIEAMRAVSGVNVPVVGIDATPMAIEALADGDLACTVFQDAVGQGVGSIEVAYKAAKGEDFDVYNWIPFELVTQENMDDYR